MTHRTHIKNLITAIDIHMSSGFPTHKALLQTRNQAIDALAASWEDDENIETPTSTTPQRPEPTVTAYSSSLAKSLRLGFDGLSVDLKAAEASLLVTRSGGNCPPITKAVDPEYLSQGIGFLNAAKEKLNGIIDQVQNVYLWEIDPIVPAQICPDVHECRLEDDDHDA